MIYKDENLLVTIEIPQYMREYKLSNHTRPKYYREGDKLPKKFQTNEYSFYKFSTIKESILIKTSTKERICENEDKVGKPNMKVISGQALYNNAIVGPARNVLVTQLHEMFFEYMTDIIKIDKYPIIIELEVHDVVRSKYSNGMLWDMTNRCSPYNKAFEDALKLSGIISDDNILKVTGPPRPLFYPIENEDERKLVYKIYHDTRDVIKKSYDYGYTEDIQLNFIKNDRKN